MSTPKDTKRSVDRAVSRALGAYTDARVDNWAYKHKQLASLFSQSNLLLTWR